MSKSTLPVGVPAAATAAVEELTDTGREALTRHRRATAAVLGAQVALDACAVLAAFVGAAALLGALGAVPPGGAALTLGILVTTVLVVFTVRGLYRPQHGLSRAETMYRVGANVSVGLMVAIAANAIILGGDAFTSRAVLLLGWLLAMALVGAGRLAHGAVIGRLRASGVGLDRLLIVGTGCAAAAVHDRVRRAPEAGYTVVGCLAHPRGPAFPAVQADLVRGTTERLAELVRQYQVDELVFALEDVSPAEIQGLTQRVLDLPVGVKVYPDVFRLSTNDTLSVGDVAGIPVVTLRRIGLRAWSRVVKRAVDLVVSSVMLAALSPLMAVLGMLIKLDSPGPVFFVQERVGYDGEPFNLLKFRSMPVDAEAETGPVRTTPDDPRPTRIGRLMRRYSLDELPQFINVFRGQMSVVGPRPERPYFVEQFRQTIPGYMARHRAKSGITGWAQVNGLRGDTSIAARTAYDLYYVENWSLLLDARIMARTLAQIIGGENAY